MAEISEKEIEEFLARLEKTDDIEFLASNFQILSGISNPKFSDRVNSLKSRIEKTCRQQAEAALAGNEPLSKNSIHPEAVLYADYAKVLELSEDEKAREMGHQLAEKAEKELEAWDKEQGLDNVDENTPFSENYEALNDRIKPFEELNMQDDMYVSFIEKVGKDDALDMANLARMEVLSELALKGEELSDEEIKELIDERTKQLIVETYTSLETGNFVFIDKEIEKLKQGYKVDVLPENADLLTFTHYAMTHIEDEHKKSLPDTEKYKALLEEALKDPEITKDPKKLAALTYLISHHDVFGVSGNDPAFEEASVRLRFAIQKATMKMAYEGVLANHTIALQIRATRIAQKTGKPVPNSLQKDIADLETKHPWVKVAKNFLIRGGLTMASGFVLGPVGPFVVSSAYAYKAFKEDREKYAAAHGGSSKGYFKSLWTKEHLPQTIGMVTGPVLSAMTLGMAGAGTSMLVSTITRSVLGLGPSVARVTQENGTLSKQKENFDQKCAALNTKDFTPEEKKIFESLTYKEIADPSKMNPKQKAVWAKIDPKDRETLEKEAQGIQKKRKAIGWTLGIAAGGLVLAAVGYEAHEHGWSAGGADNGQEGDGNPDPTADSNQNTDTSDTQSTETTETTEQQTSETETNTQEVAPQYEMKANNTQITRACKADPLDVNKAMQKLDPNWKWKNSGALREMYESGKFSPEQLKALDHIATTKFDANGHIIDADLNDYYKHLAEQSHQATQQTVQAEHPIEQPAQQSLEQTEGFTPPSPQQDLGSEDQIEHNGTLEQPAESVSPQIDDPVVDKVNNVTEFGTPENPAITLDGKNTLAAYTTTDESGNMVHHVDEFKTGRFTDQDKDGIADAINVNKQLSSNEVITSPDGEVLETTEQTFRQNIHGESVLKHELKMNYEGDNVVQTETNCHLDGSKSVTRTEFMEGTTDKPLTTTQDLYRKGADAPYATEKTQYDEFTGEKLSVKYTDNATGKVTTRSLANPKEIYNARAETLNNWQNQLQTMDPTSSGYASLADKIHRLSEAQRITATTNPQLAISVGPQGR